MLLLAPGDNVAIGHKIAARASAAAGARGSVVGSAISPVIKVCANPDTYRRMSDDMAVDAGRLLEGARASPTSVAKSTSSCSPSPAARARSPRRSATANSC